MADRLPGPRFDTTRFGRVGGWKSRFRRAGTRSTRGPLVVESRLDLFESTDGAKKDFAAYLQQFPPFAEPEPAASATRRARSRSRPAAGVYKVRYVTVVWADRNATASVSANGFDGKLQTADVLRLARAQARAMARSTRAAGGQSGSWSLIVARSPLAPTATTRNRSPHRSSSPAGALAVKAPTLVVRTKRTKR